MDIFKDTPDGVKDIIINNMIGTISISPAGAIFPILDTTAITVIWGNMLYKIAVYYNVSLTQNECIKIFTQCGVGVLSYLGGSKTLCWLLNFIPGLNIWGAMAGNVIFNGYYTYAVGMAFHKMLKVDYINGQTWWQLARIFAHYFVPIPKLSTLKGIFNVMKTHLT